jgi:hypothetical protein
MIIKKFLEYKDQTVILNNGIKTSKYGDKSLSKLNNKIKQYVEETYGKFGFKYPANLNNYKNYDININGDLINSEYIAKMVNNYTVFKMIIRVNNLRDEDSFYSFILNNMDDIYHYDGKYFDNVLNILVNTTRKGNIIEKRAIDYFEKFSKSKNMNIEVINPTVEEDLDGIDFKFKINNKIYTVQVKPFEKYNYNSDIIKVKSQGSLSLSTDYLILSNKDKFIVLRNPSDNPIKIEGDNFVGTKSHIVSIS